LEYSALGDFNKLKEACIGLKLVEVAHVRGRVESPKITIKTPTNDWNPVTYAVALNRLDIVRYFAESMKCNMRLCLAVQEDPLACLRLAMQNHSLGLTPSVFTYLLSLPLWTREDFLELIQELTDLKTKPLVLDSILGSATFSKVFVCLGSQDAQIEFIRHITRQE
jgi:hypothetical protein